MVNRAHPPPPGHYPRRAGYSFWVILCVRSGDPWTAHCAATMESSLHLESFEIMDAPPVTRTAGIFFTTDQIGREASSFRKKVNFPPN